MQTVALPPCLPAGLSQCIVPSLQKWKSCLSGHRQDTGRQDLYGASLCLKEDAKNAAKNVFFLDILGII